MGTIQPMPSTNNSFVKSLNLQAILDEAFAAAEKAAQDSLEKFGGDRDACGFAWVNIKPARGPIVTALKAHPKARVHQNYEGGGVQLWNPSRNVCQSITPKEDGTYAFVEVLAKHGINFDNTGLKMSTGSRLD